MLHQKITDASLLCFGFTCILLKGRRDPSRISWGIKRLTCSASILPELCLQDADIPLAFRVEWRGWPALLRFCLNFVKGRIHSRLIHCAWSQTAAYLLCFSSARNSSKDSNFLLSLSALYQWYWIPTRWIYPTWNRKNREKHMESTCVGNWRWDTEWYVPIGLFTKHEKWQTATSLRLLAKLPDVEDENNYHSVHRKHRKRADLFAQLQTFILAQESQVSGADLCKPPDK